MSLYFILHAVAYPVPIIVKINTLALKKVLHEGDR